MARCRSGKFRGYYPIQMIVGRLNVGTPTSEAIDYVRSKLKKGFWESLSRADQRSFACEVKRVHEANFNLYRDVMGGRF